MKSWRLMEPFSVADMERQLLEQVRSAVTWSVAARAEPAIRAVKMLRANKQRIVVPLFLSDQNFAA
jgi:hypothetical protein